MRNLGVFLSAVVRGTQTQWIDRTADVEGDAQCTVKVAREMASTSSSTTRAPQCVMRRRKSIVTRVTGRLTV
jgi:hypothetical protein